MAGSLNRVELIGNLGKDPEIRNTRDGKSIANLSIATSDTWRDKNTGERKEQTEWHRVVCFNDGLTKVIEQYCRKGDKVFVTGKLKTRKWTDQAGVEKYSTEVVMEAFSSELILLGGKDRGGDGDRGGGDRDSYTTRSGGAQSRGSPSVNRGGRNSDFDDDIPFQMEWRG